MNFRFDAMLLLSAESWPAAGLGRQRRLALDGGTSLKYIRPVKSEILESSFGSNDSMIPSIPISEQTAFEITSFNGGLSMFPTISGSLTDQMLVQRASSSHLSKKLKPVLASVRRFS